MKKYAQASQLGFHETPKDWLVKIPKSWCVWGLGLRLPHFKTHKPSVLQGFADSMLGDGGDYPVYVKCSRNSVLARYAFLRKHD